MRHFAKPFVRIYEFLVGDLILLTAVALAFGATAVLALARHEENLLLVVTLVGVIVIGVVTTIGRELGAAAPHAGKPSPGAGAGGTARAGRQNPKTDEPRRRSRP